MNTHLRSPTGLSYAIVLIHLLVVIPHSIAHMRLGIEMDNWQNIYIYLVILIAPVVSAVLLGKGSKHGYTLLSISMLGSLAFGFYYHFIAGGADNAMTLRPHTWTRTFQISAVLLAIVELAGFIIGLSGLRTTSSR